MYYNLGEWLNYNSYGVFEGEKFTLTNFKFRKIVHVDTSSAFGGRRST